MRLTVLLLFITLFSANLSAQPPTTKQAFEVKGQISGLQNGDSIHLYSYDQDRVVSSAKIKDGKFSFKGRMTAAPEIFVLRFTNGEELSGTFLLGNETLVISGDAGAPRNFSMKGSVYQKGWSKIMAIQQNFARKSDSLSRDGYEKNKTLIGNLRKQEDISMIEHVKANIDKDFAALMYLSNYKKYMPRDTLAKLYTRIPQAYLNSKYALGISSYLNQANIGDKVAGFNAIDPSGKTVSFSSLYSLKPTLLLFSAAWCQPCVQAIPELKKLHEQFGDAVNIVSFSIDANKELWLKKIKDQDIKWTNLWDGQAAYSPTYTQYGFTAIPSFLLVDKHGIILDKGTTGYEEGQYFKVIAKLNLEISK